MLAAINGCQRVIQICAHILLNGPEAGLPTLDLTFFNIDEIRPTYDSLGEHYEIMIGVPEIRTKRIVIYNSLTFTRHEVVNFHVSTPFIEVCLILSIALAFVQVRVLIIIFIIRRRDSIAYSSTDLNLSETF